MPTKAHSAGRVSELSYGFLPIGTRMSSRAVSSSPLSPFLLHVFLILHLVALNRLYRRQATTRCLSNQRRNSVRRRLATAAMQTSIGDLSTHQRQQDSPVEDSDTRVRVEIWMTCCVSRYVVTSV